MSSTEDQLGISEILWEGKDSGSDWGGISRDGAKQTDTSDILGEDELKTCFLYTISQGIYQILICNIDNYAYMYLNFTPPGL